MSITRITAKQQVEKCIRSNATAALEESTRIQRAMESNVDWLTQFIEVRKYE